MASGSETPNQDLYNSENTDDEILEGLRTEIQIIQATIRGYEAQQSANYRREERRLWIQLVTLVTVVICAALTGLLWQEIVSTRKQTEHLIEIASVQLAAANQNVTNTGKLASAAVDHAKAARDSADAAKDAIKATEGN
jgi:cytoskeletal protein RodZ